MPVTSHAFFLALFLGNITIYLIGVKADSGESRRWWQIDLIHSYHGLIVNVVGVPKSKVSPVRTTNPDL